MTEVNYKTSWYETVKPDYAEFDKGIPDFWLMVYSDRWQTICDLLKINFFDSIDTPISLLDIGCGMGRAMGWFKTFGADVMGVEPSVWAAEKVREKGLIVINDYFEKIDLSPQQFDVVYIEQVLSHAPEYKDVLRKARKALKDNGILIVEEPNDNNPLQKILEKEHGKYWVVEDHCNYFNYELIEKALNETGFEVIKKEGTWPMEIFELMGDKYIGDKPAGKSVHEKRTRMETKLSADLRIKLHEAFASLGIGRDLLIYARKDTVKSDIKMQDCL